VQLDEGTVHFVEGDDVAGAEVHLAVRHPGDHVVLVHLPLACQHRPHHVQVSLLVQTIMAMAIVTPGICHKELKENAFIHVHVFKKQQHTDAFIL